VQKTAVHPVSLEWETKLKGVDANELSGDRAYLVQDKKEKHKQLMGWKWKEGIDFASYMI
jgi:hypothetical protein